VCLFFLPLRLLLLLLLLLLLVPPLCLRGLLPSSLVVAAVVVRVETNRSQDPRLIPIVERIEISV
jgi:hypothetical protein